MFEYFCIAYAMLGSETVEDIAQRMNIPESDVPSGDAAAALVHGSKLKVL